MDTRQKIITVEELRGQDWIAVAGLFDPLTVAQAERIEAAARQDANRKLLAVVVPGRGTLLAAEARAALVAGLRNVNAVVVARVSEVRALGIEVEDDPQAEERRSKEFIDFVVARQSSK